MTNIYQDDTRDLDLSTHDSYLDVEYESAFDAEEKLIHSLMKIKSNLSIYYKEIPIDNIIVSNFKKKSREDTLIGLTGIVKEWGVVNPIHVVTLETPGNYLLAEGLRRVFAAIRVGKEVVPAMVWDFEDKQEGKDMVNIIGLMVNRSQRYTPKEMWELMKVLEEVNGLGPGLIEYLLNMNSGDAMKLKDVMLADMEYDELKQGLLEGKFDIETAYKKLCNQRKRENRLAKEDMMKIKETFVDDTQILSVDEVKELLELTDTEVEGESLEDLDRSKEIKEVVIQDPKDRKPVDPQIRQSTFIRDNFKCRCCGLGGGHRLGTLVYHHIVPVFLGGEDSVDNGLTVCVNCHLLIHIYANGKLEVNLKELNEEEQKIFRNIFKYGNIIIEGCKRVGMKRKDLLEVSRGSLRHPMPGEGLKEAKEAFERSDNLTEVST